MSAGWDPAKYDERFAEDGSLETMFTEVYVPHRGVGLWCRTGRSRSRRATASSERDSNASGMRIPGGPGVVGRPDGTVRCYSPDSGAGTGDRSDSSRLGINEWSVPASLRRRVPRPTSCE
jgi:hypothetical protein